jgi:hypothetical protein
LQLDTALKDTYKYLQKFAVGMEQVVWDQTDNNGAFKNEFADIEFKLRAVSGVLLYKYDNLLSFISVLPYYLSW